jgi:hypothetical protein
MSTLRTGSFARIHLTCRATCMTFTGRSLPWDEAEEVAQILNGIDPDNLVHTVKPITPEMENPSS